MHASRATPRASGRAGLARKVGGGWEIPSARIPFATDNVVESNSIVDSDARDIADLTGDEAASAEPTLDFAPGFAPEPSRGGGDSDTPPPADDAPSRGGDTAPPPPPLQQPTVGGSFSVPPRTVWIPCCLSRLVGSLSGIWVQNWWDVGFCCLLDLVIPACWFSGHARPKHPYI